MKLPDCPKCKSTYVYEDGNLLICPDCAYEWTFEMQRELEEEQITRDINGNELKSGDTVIVASDLKIKGTSGVIKQGTKVKNIKIINGEDGHDIDCKIEGFGQIYLKSSVVKKG